MSVFILLSFMVGPLSAEEYKIAGQLYRFETREGVQLSGCEKVKCRAWIEIQRPGQIDLKKARQHQKFKASIGSDVCKWVYQGRSTIGLAANRDQRAFCVFPDQSMIELNSLGEWLKSTKRLKSEQ
jgi:hypothetical protein